MSSAKAEAANLNNESFPFIKKERTTQKLKINIYVGILLHGFIMFVFRSLLCLSMLHLCLGVERTEKVGYRVRKLISGPGPGQVYLMRLDKSPQYFQPCLREYADL